MEEAQNPPSTKMDDAYQAWPSVMAGGQYERIGSVRSHSFHCPVLFKGFAIDCVQTLLVFW